MSHCPWYQSENQLESQMFAREYLLSYYYVITSEHTTKPQADFKNSIAHSNLGRFSLFILPKNKDALKRYSIIPNPEHCILTKHFTITFVAFTMFSLPLPRYLIS
jgi:hypothetical protein